jgi:hypothetical protein
LEGRNMAFNKKKKVVIWEIVALVIFRGDKK